MKRFKRITILTLFSVMTYIHNDLILYSNNIIYFNSLKDNKFLSYTSESLQSIKVSKFQKLMDYCISDVYKNKGSLVDLPLIIWISPSEEYNSLNTNKVKIKAKVQSLSGITSIFIYLNDTMYGEPEMTVSPTEAGTYVINKTIELNPGENKIYLLATNSEGSVKSEIRFISLLNIPKITWINPSETNTSLKSAKVNIRAEIKSQYGIDSVLFYLNDFYYGEPEMTVSQQRAGTYFVNQTVELKPGDNTMYFIAANREGTTTSNKRFVYVPVLTHGTSTYDSIMASLPNAPLITWLNPSDTISSPRDSKANIKVEVKTRYGIDSIKVYLNDILYGEPELTTSATDIGTYIVSKTINLETGENKISFIATNSKGSSSSDKRFVYIPMSTSDSPTVDSLMALLPTLPLITWLNPSDTISSLRVSKANIKVEVKSRYGIDSMKVFLNDILYGEPELTTSTFDIGTYIVSKTVYLEPGENKLYFVATNSKGSTTSDKRCISVPMKTEVPFSTSSPQPPEITWELPKNKTITLKSSSTDIRIKIKSISDLKSIVLYLNGIPQGKIETINIKYDNESYILEKTINFSQVENNIYFQVENLGGVRNSLTRYFICPASGLTVSQSTNKGEDKSESAKNPAIIPLSADKVSLAGVAPVITWTSPSGLNTTLDSFFGIVKAKIKSGYGLKSVILYLNGISKGEAEIRPSNEDAETFLVEKTVTFGPGQNNIYLVATNSEGSTKSELRYFSNPAAVLPVVIWSNPVVSTSLVNVESLIISACIKSPTDLKSIKLFVNGNVQTEENVFPALLNEDCNYTWQSSAVLKEGDNSIFIIATNVAGSTTSEKRVIKLSKAIIEKRLAVIIGNSDYKNKAPLKNPVNDANLMEGTLKELGFEVIKRLNATKDQMMSAIREFDEKLPDYSIALFYYAGHGIQVDGKNYVIPTDAVLEKPGDCKYEAIDVSFIVEEFERYQDNTNIVILDACRKNPFASWTRNGEAGFKIMNFSSGTIVAFATSEGATAADGKGLNGLYTQELVKQMLIPQPLSTVFMNTRVQVRKLSNNQQVPSEINMLNGEFFFKK